MPNWTYNEMRFKSEDDCKKVAQLMKSKNEEFDFNNVIPMPTYLNNIPGFSTTQHVQALAYAFSKGKQVTEREMEAAIKTAYPQIKTVAKTPQIDELLAKTRKPYVLSKNDVIILTRVADNTNYQDEIDHYKSLAFDDCTAKTYADYAELIKRAVFETGSFDWYSWSVEHWGTKWNACNPEIDIPNKRIYWETAWSPTPNIVMAIHKKTNVPIYYIYTEEQITEIASEMIFKDQKVKIHEDIDAEECSQLAAFMGVIDPNECRIASGDYPVYDDEDEWASAKEITPKASLEEEFLDI